MNAFDHSLSRAALDVERVLDRLLPKPAGPESQLLEAMRYASLSGGKRLRPYLLLSSADMFGVARDGALLAAAAVECVHCYSLVHDDLPAMDDDDLRRGQPTTHKQFSEATAILTGDALLTLAFEVLSDEAVHADPGVRVEMIKTLSYASGVHGMVGGQMIDLSASELDHTETTITRLQQMKTGALIAAACELGAIMGHAARNLRHALHAYAHDLGLAFQIADDLLDFEGDEEQMGKRARKDAAAGKATFVGILGVERARTQAALLKDQAIRHLAPFEDKADPLRELAEFAVNRSA